MPAGHEVIPEGVAVLVRDIGKHAAIRLTLRYRISLPLSSQLRDGGAIFLWSLEPLAATSLLDSCDAGECLRPVFLFADCRRAMAVPTSYGNHWRCDEFHALPIDESRW